MNPSDHMPVWVDIDWQATLHKAGIEPSNYTPEGSKVPPELIRAQMKLQAELARLHSDGPGLSADEIEAIRWKENLAGATRKEVTDYYRDKTWYLLRLADRELRRIKAEELLDRMPEIPQADRPAVLDLVRRVMAYTLELELTPKQVHSHQWWGQKIRTYRADQAHHLKLRARRDRPRAACRGEAGGCGRTSGSARVDRAQSREGLGPRLGARPLKAPRARSARAWSTLIER